MNLTYTPELKPNVLDRIAGYAASFRDDFNRPRQAAWCGVYLRGLIQDCDRKGAEPMAARVPLPEGLYLPESWLGAAKRLDKAKVPAGERRPLTRGEIALELLDRVRGEGLAGGLVVADSGYGVSGPFRDGLAQRGLHYIVGVTDEMVVFTEEPRWVGPEAATGGRPRKRHRLAEDSPRPVSLKDLAARTPRRKVKIGRASCRER